MEQIVACSSHTFLRHYPQSLDDLRTKVLQRVTPMIGSLLLKNTHSISCTGPDKIQFPLIEPGQSVAEFIEGFYDAEFYDVQRASIRGAFLVQAKKTAGPVTVKSNAANYFINLQLRGAPDNPQVHTLGDECEELFSIPESDEELSHKIPLMPIYAPITYVNRSHQQLLGVFGPDLLNNLTLIIDHKGKPHRVISAFHLVAEFIAIKETLQFPVVALGDQLEQAELFIIPEGVFQQLAKMCYDLYIEHWEYIDATQFKFEVVCPQAITLKMELEWEFDLPLKQLPDSLKKEEIVMLTGKAPMTVLALINMTDQREYVFRKKSAYDKAVATENQ